jgi:hypothetical protein
MSTVRIVLDLLPVVVLGWLVTAGMFWLMSRSLPWPYPRHWRWGSATLEAEYTVRDAPDLDPAHATAEAPERFLARVDWLDHNLRRN